MDTHLYNSTMPIVMVWNRQNGHGFQHLAFISYTMLESPPFEGWLTWKRLARAATYCGSGLEISCPPCFSGLRMLFMKI